MYPMILIEVVSIQDSFNEKKSESDGQLASWHILPLANFYDAPTKLPVLMKGTECER